MSIQIITFLYLEQKTKRRFMLFTQKSKKALETSATDRQNIKGQPISNCC